MQGWWDSIQDGYVQPVAQKKNCKNQGQLLMGIAYISIFEFMTRVYPDNYSKADGYQTGYDKFDNKNQKGLAMFVNKTVPALTPPLWYSHFHF